MTPKQDDDLLKAAMAFAAEEWKTYAYVQPEDVGRSAFEFARIALADPRFASPESVEDLRERLRKCGQAWNEAQETIRILELSKEERA